MPRAPLNYSTNIPAARTVGEVITLLAEAGASEVGTKYRDRRPVGIGFEVLTPAGRRAFTLPVNAEKVLAVMQRAKAKGHLKAHGVPVTQDQAERVGWRILKDWIEAQLAIIEAELVTLDEVMLPYMHIEGPGRPTVYEFAQARLQSLPSGS